jgi:hypothetical protein
MEAPSAERFAVFAAFAKRLAGASSRPWRVRVSPWAQLSKVAFEGDG